MSDAHNTTAAAAPAEVVADRAMTESTPVAPVEETAAPATTTEAAVPATATTEAPKTEETTAAPVAAEEKTEEEAAAPATEAKVAEPIVEGQLGYKAPGLLKQFTFSKKEFWLNDAAVTPQNLGLYLRGEKSEISHPVTAWASQTGKGLLFFNKKGESDRTQPAGVIALYDATDLKKASPHEFTFDVSGHKHSFKANNDAERDGWYQSIEKAIELGKASKESVRDSEGYKAEIEKLNTPNTVGAAVSVPKTRGQSQPKKSTDAADAAEPQRTGSSDGDDDELKKKAKSRSTSRGMLNRLKGKKEEAEVKKEEKKEEKAAEKEEKAAEKEEAKAEESTPAVAAVAPVTAASAAAPVESTTAEPTTETTAAPAEEKPIEALPAAEAKPETKAEEKPKVSKRGSIFGKLPSAWGNLKSPKTEKAEKDAELKPEVPAKDAAVADAPPQLPETAATEPIETPVVAPATEASKPEITETAPEASKTDAATPNKEKKNFLSGLSFMNKRDRSVSPSAAVKEQPVKTETPAAAPVTPAKEETPAVEPVKAEEPATTETAPVAAPVATETADKVEEPKAADATSPNGNKRSSMLGNLGRRASKALNRIQPKKENAAPAAAEKKTEETAEPAVEKKADETTSTEPAAPAAAPNASETVADTIVPTTAAAEENKPEAVGVNTPTPVAASA